MVKIEGVKAHDIGCEKKIFNKYREIENKGICTKCKARNNLTILNNELPTSLFVVGKNFRFQNPRILFVGKTLRGGWDEDEEDGSTAAKIYDDNKKEIFIDITKDKHEELSFKDYDHMEDILIKCFKKYDWDAIERFFIKRQYPDEVISDICTMLNDNEYKKDDKPYDEKASKELLKNLSVEDIKNYLFKDSGEPKSRGSPHPLSRGIKYVLKCVYNMDDVDELWRRTAITNIVKCSVSLESDETTLDMAMNCISNAGFIKAEIEMIQPTHVVFFTADGGYLDYIKKLEFENLTHEQINEKPIRIGVHTKKEIGTEQQPKVMWWYRVFFDDDNSVKMHILVTRHPRGACNEWKEEIAEWTKYTRKNINKKNDIKALKLKYS